MIDITPKIFLKNSYEYIQVISLYDLVPLSFVQFTNAPNVQPCCSPLLTTLFIVSNPACALLCTPHEHFDATRKTKPTEHTSKQLKKEQTTLGQDTVFVERDEWTLIKQRKNKTTLGFATNAEQEKQDKTTPQQTELSAENEVQNEGKEKPEQCEEDSSFGCASALKGITEELHINITPIDCPLCDIIPMESKLITEQDVNESSSSSSYLISFFHFRLFLSNNLAPYHLSSTNEFYPPSI